VHGLPLFQLIQFFETMEILADLKAMKAIRDAEAGRGKVFAAKDLP
jgi:hypothetical protein